MKCATLKYWRYYIYTLVAVMNKWILKNIVVQCTQWYSMKWSILLYSGNLVNAHGTLTLFSPHGDLANSTYNTIPLSNKVKEMTHMYFKWSQVDHISWTYNRWTLYNLHFFFMEYSTYTFCGINKYKQICAGIRDCMNDI